MIVKDEELTIKRVLDSAVIFADEIIIVDTGSVDKTVEIAKSMAKVYRFEWINDFSAARNYAFSLAKSDYLMWLDADDVITPYRAEMLKDLKNTLSADVVMLPYYIGEPPKITFWRERILKRNKGYRFKGRVHEAIEVFGNIAYENIPIVHDKLKKSDPTRNLKIFQNMLDDKESLSPRETFYYGNELYYNGKFEDAQLILTEFLNLKGCGADKGQAALFLSRMQTTTKDKKKYLIKGLSYAYSPDLLCMLGDIYLEEKNYSLAKICFLNALVADENITFPNPDNKNYMPHIRLCRCYWNLGNKSNSEYHNKMALIAKPNDKFALANTALFK